MCAQALGLGVFLCLAGVVHRWRLSYVVGAPCPLSMHQGAPNTELAGGSPVAFPGEFFNACEKRCVCVCVCRVPFFFKPSETCYMGPKVLCICLRELT